MKDLTTERRNENTKNLHNKDTRQILQAINKEDKKVASAVEACLPEIELAVETFVQTFQTGGNLRYIGAGTSGRIGVLDAAEVTPTFGVPSYRVRGIIAGGIGTIVNPKESKEDEQRAGSQKVDEKMDAGDMLIGITSSGETPFVLGGLSRAKDNSISTAVITSNTGTTAGELADIAIVAETGPEVIAGSTRMKAGTAQKMIVNMITTTAMVKLGKVYDNLMIDVVATNEKLQNRAQKILGELTDKPEDNIESTLEDTDYEVKPALLTLEFDVELERAKSILDRNNGMLDAAIEELMG